MQKYPLGLQVLSSINVKSGGIYFLYNFNKELMYIGKAVNIRSRLLMHINSTWGDEVAHNYYYADYILISSEEEREEAETRLINMLKPPLNRAKIETYESEYYSLKYNPDYHKKEELFRKLTEKKLEEFHL